MILEALGSAVGAVKQVEDGVLKIRNDATYNTKLKKNKREEEEAGFVKSVGAESRTKVGMFIVTPGRIQIRKLSNLEKDLFANLKELREQGNLNDEIQEETYAKHRKQHHNTYKQLHKMFPEKRS